MSPMTDQAFCNIINTVDNILEYDLLYVHKN